MQLSPDSLNPISSMAAASGKENFVIVIHAGAENKSRGEVGTEKEKACRQGLHEALQAGWGILNRGGTAVEAVEGAVRSLEDNPLFNAGRGGALTQTGKTTFDAAIMNGENLNTGAVMGVKNVKNPITLARTIMEKSDHVALSGEGALAFAKEEELELMPNPYFITGMCRFLHRRRGKHYPGGGCPRGVCPGKIQGLIPCRCRPAGPGRLPRQGGKGYEPDCPEPRRRHCPGVRDPADVPGLPQRAGPTRGGYLGGLEGMLPECLVVVVVVVVGPRTTVFLADSH